MKPAPFDYHSPATVEDALRLLEQHSGEARLLAGGQTLIPMMNYRVATPAVLVDLNGIASLDYIKSDDRVVRIGAMTRQRAIQFSPIVANDLPLLREAVGFVGHLPTRSRGTIGGSLANADPAAELPMALQALEGEVTVVSLKGERTIPAHEFFVDTMTTTIEPDEILTEVRFPVMGKRARYAVEEFSRRRGDFAIAAIAVMLVEDGGKCAKARISTAGISSHSTRLRDVEKILEGSSLDEETVAAAARVASEVVEPISDRNGSAEYRRHLAGVLTRRSLSKAAGIELRRTPAPAVL